MSKVSKSYRMDKLTLSLLDELAEQSKQNDKKSSHTDLIRKSVLLYAAENLPNFNEVISKNV